MKHNLHLILWILTIALMTLAIADEFLSGQPLSLLGFVFVLALVVGRWRGRGGVDWQRL
jgi:cytochrome b561